MSNEEHLIENALTFLEMTDNPHEALHNKRDQMMAEACSIDLDQIWLMAQHVYFTLKPIWEDEAIQKHEQYLYEEGFMH